MHLSNHQGNDGSMSDAVESHLPNTDEDILEIDLQHTGSCIQGVIRVVCHQSECLQLHRQNYNKKKEVIRRGSRKQSNQI